MPENLDLELYWNLIYEMKISLIYVHYNHFSFRNDLIIYKLYVLIKDGFWLSAVLCQCS